MDLKDTYNKIAVDWFKDHKEDDWWVAGTNKFVSLLDNNKSLVLDVGCGAGVKSKYLLDKGLRVVGIDFSEKMIEIAKREVPGASFYVADIKQLDNLEEIFDGIFAQAVLLHVAKKEVVKILKKIKEKLKPGGFLYIAVKETKPGSKDEKVEIEEDYGYQYERFFSYFTMAEVKKYLSEIKMKVVYEKIIPNKENNWVQVICQNTWT